MKTQARSILLTLVCAASASLLVIGSLAQAGFIVTLKQVGSNVVETGSGAIDLTGLTFYEHATEQTSMAPVYGVIYTGTGFCDIYQGVSGPTSFGSGGYAYSFTGSGDVVGIFSPFSYLVVPLGYTSESALSNLYIYNNATFSSLGLTPGTYEWTWGDGGANQNFTLEISVPDGGSTVFLLGFALAGLAVLRRKLRC